MLRKQTFNQAQKRERTEEKVRYGEGPTKMEALKIRRWYFSNSPRFAKQFS
jgi:hypothetical protein